MTASKLKPSVDGPLAATLGALTGARVHVDVTIPRTTAVAKMRLVGRDEAFSITVETRKLFADKKIPIDVNGMASVGVVSEWNNEIAVRHLAVAVRDPSDTSKPFESLDAWRACDDDQISALWEQYKDLQDRIDPLYQDTELTADEVEKIRAAVKKKDPSTLRSFGSSTLCRYLLTTADPPAP